MANRKANQNAARIQRAVTGLQIPMTIITRLYAHAEKLIADGADDEQLAAGVRQFLNPPAFVDVGTVTEYGMTQKLSSPVRCF